MLGAEVTATLASGDPGFFNYTDYEYSALRNVRFGVSAEVRASRRVQCSASCASITATSVQPTALYARIRPWPIAALRHAGRPHAADVRRVRPRRLRHEQPADRLPARLPVPDVAAPRRAAGDDRRSAADARPRLARRTSRLATPPPSAGCRSSTPFRWDTGVQVHGVTGLVEWTGAVTTGSLSNPRVDDDNDGRQVAGRAVVRPPPALAVGASAARGAFLSRVARRRAAGRAPRRRRRAAGGRRRRRVPRGTLSGARRMICVALDAAVAARRRSTTPLTATSVLGEARYRILPGVHLAARAEHLGFSRMSRPRATAGLGGAGLALRGRRWLVGDPQRHASRPRGSATCATAAASVTNARRRAGRVLVLMRDASQRPAPSLAAVRPLRAGIAVAARAAPCGAATPRTSRRLRAPFAAGSTSAASHGPPSAARRRRARRRRPPRHARPPPRRRLSRDGAARRVRGARAGPRGDGPAQRDVRAARARGHGRHGRRLPQQRPTYHNVFSLSKAKRFDLGRYAAGRSKSVRFDRPGVVRVFCDIHSHMNAFVARVQPSVLRR